VKKIFAGKKPEIDPADLPTQYKAQLKGAKAGDWVGVSSTKAGKIDFSLIKKPEAKE
jgi:hypothetical protein